MGQPNSMTDEASRIAAPIGRSAVRIPTGRGKVSGSERQESHPNGRFRDAGAAEGPAASPGVRRPSTRAVVTGSVPDPRPLPVHLESLPFELFQNADDASVEMTQMVTEADAGSSRIVLEYDDVTLRFAHWGRPINRFRVSGFSAEEGRARGFDRDLEKMLVLSASDKDMGHGEVTGKFGLGFKTVFLLSDSPEVVSDRLAFRVLGGMLPQALDPDRKEQLRQRLAHYGPTSAGTLVELFAGGAKPVEALGRFLNLVHITLAFAHAVKILRDSPSERQSGTCVVGGSARQRVGASPSWSAPSHREFRSGLQHGGVVGRVVLSAPDASG